MKTWQVVALAGACAVGGAGLTYAVLDAKGMIIKTKKADAVKAAVVAAQGAAAK
jgi:hypothetical protein